MSIANESWRPVIGGVDTTSTSICAALSGRWTTAGHAEFPTDLDRPPAPAAWTRGFGNVQSVGIEGTGSSAHLLTRFFAAARSRGA